MALSVHEHNGRPMVAVSRELSRYSIDTYVTETIKYLTEQSDGIEDAILSIESYFDGEVEVSLSGWRDLTQDEKDAEARRKAKAAERAKKEKREKAEAKARRQEKAALEALKLARATFPEKFK